MWRDYYYLKLTREELYRKVWSTPAHRLKEELGISDVMIGKICKQNGIPKPPLGYWARVAAGQQIRTPPLPKAKKGQDEYVYIRKRPPDPYESLKATAKRMSGTFEKVSIPQRLGCRVHPLVEATRNGLREARASLYGRLTPPPGYEGMDIRVSKKQLPRALRIMQGLLGVLEAHGYKVTSIKENYRNEMTTLIDGQPVYFQMTEYVQQVERPPSTAAARYGSWGSRMEYFPRGRLKFVLEDYRTHSPRASWGDTNQNSLEDKLHLVVKAILERVEITSSRRQKMPAVPMRNANGKQPWNAADRRS